MQLFPQKPSLGSKSLQKKKKKKAVGKSQIQSPTTSKIWSWDKNQIMEIVRRSHVENSERFQVMNTGFLRIL
jgi:hypothetical protein